MSIECWSTGWIIVIVTETKILGHGSFICKRNTSEPGTMPLKTLMFYFSLVRIHIMSVLSSTETLIKTCKSFTSIYLLSILGQFNYYYAMLNTVTCLSKIIEYSSCYIFAIKCMSCFIWKFICSLFFSKTKLFLNQNDNRI